MKKAVKVFGGLLLVLLFCGAVMMYFNTYRTNEKEETEKKEVSVKVPKTTFELKEDAEIGDFIYNVSEAELIEDYEKIDDYYKERGYVLSPKEYIKAWVGPSDYNDIFPGDVRFLRVKYSVKNNSDAKLDFSPDSMIAVNIMNGETEPYELKGFDSRGTSNDGKEEIEFGGRKVSRSNNPEESTAQAYTLSPGETIEVESVGEFTIFNQYDMYISDRIDTINDSYDIYLMKSPSIQRIHLDIEGSFGNGADAYAKVREIQKMKYESWTNLERKEWMEKWIEEELEWSAGTELSHPTKEIVESSEPGQRFVDIFYEGVLEPGGDAVYGFCLETILDNFQTVEWKDLPTVYTEQGNLQRMAERYQSVYGCKEEEMRVLLLDLSYVSSEIGELESYQKKAVNYFYGRSNIYVKDEEKEELYWFGQADDWTVVSNSKNPENIGPINLINMEPEEVITVQMAYILPPALYEQYDALYFTGGRYALTYHDEIVPITRIALK